MRLSSVHFVPAKASNYAWWLTAGNIAPPGWWCWIAHNFHQKPVSFKNRKWALCSCLWWSHLCCRSSCLALETIMIQIREHEATTTWGCESDSHSLGKYQVIIVVLGKTEPVKIDSQLHLKVYVNMKYFVVVCRMTLENGKSWQKISVQSSGGHEHQLLLIFLLPLEPACHGNLCLLAVKGKVSSSFT